ncbi:hypothetical protein ACGFZK_36505 [Streptomyces sp. NPDC048257]|uniref:hypothetical protein n=1 Tax=Streptomyces sp. NPDC048257 TaxID=3365526 RepID=UPI0037118532
MRTIQKLAVLGASVGAFALPTSLSPAVAATLSGPSVATCEGAWTFSEREGRGSGCFHNNGTYVSGTVYDTKSDGRCPFIRAVFDSGTWRDSNWATGNGTHANVSINTPDGSRVNHVEWHYIYC